MSATPSSAGTGDAVFVHRLREFMEDMPLFLPEQVSPNGNSTEYKCSKFPIYDGDPFLTIKVNGVNQTLVPTRNDLSAPGQVAIDFETGWMFWATAPVQGSNTIQIRKSQVRYRDEKMLEALYTGLKLMFPRVWQAQQDVSITLTTNQWDYALPSIFNDPRIVLYRVEMQFVPNTTEPFRPLQTWRRVGNTLLHIPHSNNYPPGSILRLNYAGPYQSLGDLEEQLSFLPLLYAKGYLLSNKEIVRARISTANITQDENAQPPGVSQNAGAFFIREFDNRLDNLKRPMPHGPVQLSYAM